MSVNDNIFKFNHFLPSIVVMMIMFSFIVSPIAVYSQNGRDQVNEIVPFEKLLERPVELRKEVSNSRPRLFFNSNDIKRYRSLAKGEGKEFWEDTKAVISTLRRQAPDPKDEDLYKSGLDKRKAGSITQYSMAFQIAQTSFAYAVEQDERYLTAAKAWIKAACEMPLWGYTYNKPNVDLPPAHLLYAVSFAYDLLYNELTPEERVQIREKLTKQGRLMYQYFKHKPGKRYTYTQNHTWIPMAGLAIAAYAIMDEVEEAKEWAKLSRAVFDRTMLAFGTDGYFYESFHYFGFAFRWMIRYFDAHKAATGEDLYAVMKPKFDGMKYYVMHSVLPDRKNIFDIADIGDGALNRNETGKRESVYAEYDILYRMASVYKDPYAQAVADFMRNETELSTREPMWAFINKDHQLKAAALSELPLTYHFKDNDTVYWRSDWTRSATAFVFRSSPPEGHHATGLAPKIKDWRQNTGHAHPDANSFIIWANGKYLTGDTGYLGIKQTDDHNTILVNGKGQESDGVYEMFKNMPNDRLAKIRIAQVVNNKDIFYARGEAASGYYTGLGLKKFDRHFLYIKAGFFVVWDELETNAPSTFSFLLNADREIKIDGNNADLINLESALRVTRLEPEEAKTEMLPQEVRFRGMPGSVDKGGSEIRGMQFKATATADSKSFEFVHLLIPYKTKETSGLPKSTVFNKQSRELLITWQNGDTHKVLLNSVNGEAIKVFHTDPDGKLK